MKLTNLKTKYLGRDFIFYNQIDSTQNEIFRRIENNNIKNGTLVMADIQTNGKGTLVEYGIQMKHKILPFPFI